jgi:hypothetical protein
MSKADGDLEARAHDLAIHGFKRRTTTGKDGREIAEYDPMDRLLVAVLKSRMPKQWSDKITVNVTTGENGISITLSDFDLLTEDQSMQLSSLLEVIRLGRKAAAALDVTPEAPGVPQLEYHSDDEGSYEDFEDS